MAAPRGGDAGGKKGKKPHKNKLTSKKYSKYSIQGNSIKRNAKQCPRCGGGVFLAEHKDRVTCGKCKYTEFMGKGSK